MSLRKEFLIVLPVVALIFVFTYIETYPVRQLMDWRSSRNSLAEQDVSLSRYDVYDHTQGQEPEITVDILKGKHFWSPQVAIWLEDPSGNFLETLLVTTSTAKGLFYTGRSAATFMQNDAAKKEEQSPTRRVDALPYWSHKRGHRYPDGMYSPPPDQPLPDAITSPTPNENFYFQAPVNGIHDLPAFKILVEVNVAFDENEYYSEYDFTDDTLYHSGTGLLGQPSLVYSATIRRDDRQRYYLLALEGHGHHSGSTGDLIPETTTITTAKYIVERIVVGVNEKWHQSSD